MAITFGECGLLEVGMRELSGGDETVLYLNWSVGYTAVYICQVTKLTFKICVFHSLYFLS